jgi:hypothetical protein
MAMKVVRLTGSRRKVPFISFAGVVQRAQGACRQAFEALVLLQRQEGGEDGVLVALVQVVADDFKKAATVQKALIDDAHGRILRAVYALLNVEDQDAVELRDRLGSPVVAAHQHFAGTQSAGVGGSQMIRLQRFEGRTPDGLRGDRQSGAGARGSA